MSISPLIRYRALLVFWLDSPIAGCTVCAAPERNVLPGRLNENLDWVSPENVYVLHQRGRYVAAAQGVGTP